MTYACAICGKTLPNRWSIAKHETIDGVERYYCPLCANKAFNAKKISKENSTKEEPMEENNVQAKAAKEEAIAHSASGDLAKKAWAECSALAEKLGGGVKTLWTKIHPDRSPEAMLSALNENLTGNKTRLNEMKPELDDVYRAIVSKKKDYQSAPPARQRILKIELQTLMARYKSLEREFTILSENERSIEQVKGRFLEILAYGKRGKIQESMIDQLTDDIDDKADEAEDIQDALGDLERAGKRTDRAPDTFDDELAGFDGELGLSETNTTTNTNDKENNHENSEIDPVDGSGDTVAERAGCIA